MCLPQLFPYLDKCDLHHWAEGGKRKKDGKKLWKIKLIFFYRAEQFADEFFAELEIEFLLRALFSISFRLRELFFFLSFLAIELERVILHGKWTL